MKKLLLLFPIFTLFLFSSCEKEQALQVDDETQLYGSSAGMQEALDHFDELAALFTRMYNGGLLTEAQRDALAPNMRLLRQAIENNDVRTAYRILDHLGFTVRRMFNADLLNQGQAGQVGRLLEAIRSEL